MNRLRDSLPSWLLTLAVAVVFALSYRQAPLYTSNQNAAFVRGAAAAGYGRLSNDWITGTSDPVPMVTAIVEATFRVGRESWFYAYLAILGAVYAFALIEIGSAYADLRRGSAGWWLFVACLVALHAEVLTRVGRALGNERIGAHLELGALTGVAGQYALGHYFEPSTFGVLFFAAILLFLRERMVEAVLLSALISLIHPSYFLSGLLLVMAFTATSYAARHQVGKMGQMMAALAMGGLAFLPTALFIVLNFGPTTTDMWRQSQDILVDIRVPHHARPDVWFHRGTVAQLALISFAAYLTRRTKLFWVLTVPFVVAVVLTTGQLLSGNKSLAMLFPWRVSAILVPLATTVIVAHIASLLTGSHKIAVTPFASRMVSVASAAIVVVLAAIGTMALVRLPRDAKSRRTPLEAFVAANLSSSDMYVIPVEMENFRLRTGAPIVADWKFAPARDADVVEWFARFQRVNKLYAEPGPQKCETMATLTQMYRANSFVLPRSAGATSCRGFRVEYADSLFLVYRASGT